MSSNHSNNIQIPEPTLQDQLLLARVGIHLLKEMSNWFRKADQRFSKAVSLPGAAALSDKKKVCFTYEEPDDIVCVTKEGPQQFYKTCVKLKRGQRFCGKIEPSSEDPSLKDGWSTEQLKSKTNIASQIGVKSLVDRKYETRVLLKTAARIGTIGYLGNKLYKLYRWFNPKMEPLIKNPENIDEHCW